MKLSDTETDYATFFHSLLLSFIVFKTIKINCETIQSIQFCNREKFEKSKLESIKAVQTIHRQPRMEKHIKQHFLFDRNSQRN